MSLYLGGKKQNGFYFGGKKYTAAWLNGVKYPLESYQLLYQFTNNETTTDAAWKPLVDGVTITGANNPIADALFIIGVENTIKDISPRDPGGNGGWWYEWDQYNFSTLYGTKVPRVQANDDRVVQVPDITLTFADGTQAHIHFATLNKYSPWSYKVSIS